MFILEFRYRSGACALQREYVSTVEAEPIMKNLLDLKVGGLRHMNVILRFDTRCFFMPARVATCSLQHRVSAAG